MPGRASLLVRGRIATLAGDHGFGWVEAIAVGEGRIVAAGRWADVEAVAGAGTRHLRLDAGQVAVPALTDAHLHLLDAAVARGRLHLDDLPLGDALGRIAALHQARLADGDIGGWIEGLGWSLDAFGQWPRADDLERVAPGRPVALWSHDLHTRWVSQAALAAAGITAATPDPGGGAIGRDEHGAPDGVLLEHAAGLVDHAIPGPSDDQLAGAIDMYAGELARLGVVGCHDPGGLAPDPSMRRGPLLYARLAQRGRLPLRVHGSVRPEQLDEAA
ncbi:MAG TPA: amidohydrolase family protein, partial [Candidatus Sulfotelmatobacter sp.]|nr:amidohydrolase family protein [Candidatus Sulfotelmatobacter sp.]